MDCGIQGILLVHVSSSDWIHRYLAIRYPQHSQRAAHTSKCTGGHQTHLGALNFSGPYLIYYPQSVLVSLTVCHPAWSAPRRNATDLCTFAPAGGAGAAVLNHT